MTVVVVTAGGTHLAVAVAVGFADAIAVAVRGGSVVAMGGRPLPQADTPVARASTGAADGAGGGRLPIATPTPMLIATSTIGIGTR